MYPTSIQITNSKGVSGFGTIAFLKETGEPVVLSCCHVMLGKGSQEGDKIWRYESTKNDSGASHLGNILKGVLGNFWFHNKEYFMDCAICSIIGDQWQSTKRCHQVIGECNPNDVVKKGRAISSVMFGKVSTCDYMSHARLDAQEYYTKNQILVRSSMGNDFSKKGDSGELLWNIQDEIIGLIWGNTAEGDTLASPIQPVLTALQIVL